MTSKSEQLNKQNFNLDEQSLHEKNCKAHAVIAGK